MLDICSYDMSRGRALAPIAHERQERVHAQVEVAGAVGRLPNRQGQVRDHDPSSRLAGWRGRQGGGCGRQGGRQGGRGSAKRSAEWATGRSAADRQGDWGMDGGVAGSAWRPVAARARFPMRRQGAAEARVA